MVTHQAHTAAADTPVPWYGMYLMLFQQRGIRAQGGQAVGLSGKRSRRVTAHCPVVLRQAMVHGFA